ERLADALPGAVQVGRKDDCATPGKLHALRPTAEVQRHQEAVTAEVGEDPGKRIFRRSKNPQTSDLERGLGLSERDQARVKREHGLRVLALRGNVDDFMVG